MLPELKEKLAAEEERLQQEESVAPDVDNEADMEASRI